MAIFAYVWHSPGVLALAAIICEQKPDMLSLKWPAAAASGAETAISRVYQARSMCSVQRRYISAAKSDVKRVMMKLFDILAEINRGRAKSAKRSVALYQARCAH